MKLSNSHLAPPGGLAQTQHWSPSLTLVISVPCMIGSRSGSCSVSSAHSFTARLILCICGPSCVCKGPLLRASPQVRQSAPISPPPLPSVDMTPRALVGQGMGGFTASQVFCFRAGCGLTNTSEAVSGAPTSISSPGLFLHRFLEKNYFGKWVYRLKYFFK